MLSEQNSHPLCINYTTYYYYYYIITVLYREHDIFYINYCFYYYRNDTRVVTWNVLNIIQ